MNIKRPKNTKEKGVIEFMVYKEGKTFVGVCLTFDIVEEGNDPHKLMESIKEAAQLHLEVVRELGWSDKLLNRYAPEEYWKKYFQAISSTKKPILSPYSFLSLPYPSFLKFAHA
ncbi:MAG TPA: hypothetical protein VJI66_01775 [Candidatus Paceibacterota bacterium]